MPEFIYEYKNQYKLLTIKPDVSVEELDELYNKSRVVVVPLLSGAGVKGKVIEAMAKGVPVVGTPIAFEGMVKDDTFIYEGDETPGAMIDRIMATYNDREMWERYVAFGKKYVSENFNKEKMRQVFEKIIG